MSHLQNGLSILNSSRARARGLQSVEYSSNTEFINQNVHGIFARLEAQLTLFGKPVPDLYELEILEQNSKPTVPLLFTNFFEAKFSIDLLITSSLRFVASIMDRKYAGTLPISVYTQQLELQSLLQQWLSRFEALTKTMTQRIDFQTRREEILLRLHFTAAFIWLTSCLSPHQSIFDAYTKDFESIISLAEEFAALSNITSSFNLDMAIIPPLFLTAIKCRQPLIRRKAVQKLHATPVWEGLWHSKIHAQVAERIIAIEESALGEFDDVPPELARVHNAQIMDESAQVGVTFYMKSCAGDCKSMSPKRNIP